MNNQYNHLRMSPVYTSQKYLVERKGPRRLVVSCYEKFYHQYIQFPILAPFQQLELSMAWSGKTLK